MFIIHFSDPNIDNEPLIVTYVVSYIYYIFYWFKDAARIIQSPKNSLMPAAYIGIHLTVFIKSRINTKG